MKIPGINSKNIKNIMSKVTNLNELCQMNEEQINEIIENSKNAKMIHEFINKAIKNISIFEKELDFEDLNDFFEAEKKIDLNLAGKTKQTKKVSTNIRKKAKQ